MRAQHTSAMYRLVPVSRGAQWMLAVAAIVYAAPRLAIRGAGPARAGARCGAAMAVRFFDEAAGAASTGVNTVGAGARRGVDYQVKEGGQ